MINYNGPSVANCFTLLCLLALRICFEHIGPFSAGAYLKPKTFL